jgi:hypothetical protein
MISVGKPERKGPLGSPNIDEGLILKWILERKRMGYRLD